MSLLKSANTIGLITGLVSLASLVSAGDSPALSGQILGEVRSAAGITQMGAAVYLYNHSNQLIRQVLSNQDGKFVFDGVSPDVYWIRVSLASFLPAIRHDIAVAAGSESELRINLSSVLNSVELTPGSAPPGTLMSDEWKWVLRSSHSTRPVLRLQPGTSSSRASSVFSDTTGMVRLSAGDGDLASGNMQQDLGTAFAVATSVNGSNQVHVSGNVGYAATGVPSAGLRTTYSRKGAGDDAPGPRMSVTVRQIYLPSLSVLGVLGAGSMEAGDAPVLRTASLSIIDSLKLSDALNLEYGGGLDSVSLFGRVSYFSPFARATYDLGHNGAAQLAYSSGGTPTELINGGAGAAPDVSQDLAALGQLPNISRRDGQAAVQRTRTYEAGYHVTVGSRTYSASVYRDETSNAAFLISGESGVVSQSDLLPDLNSRGIVYNVGDVRRGGYGVSVDQSLGDHAGISVAGGRGDALVAAPGGLGSSDLRSGIRSEARPWATAQVGGSVPRTGTYLGTSYGWSEPGALTPTHAYLTGKTNQQTGWNVHARQRLPGMGNVHMELTAEMRNILAQGYLTIRAGGQQAVLTNSPRAVRGGLNFIF
jgi:hypothetical protein